MIFVANNERKTVSKVFKNANGPYQKLVNVTGITNGNALIKTPNGKMIEVTQESAKTYFEDMVKAGWKVEEVCKSCGHVKGSVSCCYEPEYVQ